MKTTLIYAIDKNLKKEYLYGQYNDEISLCPPLSIVYLGAVAEEHGFEIRLIDDLIHSNEELLSAINESDVVGISSLTPNFNRAVELINLAKEKGKITVVGGVHATILPQDYFKYSDVDFVVVGEGENTFIELLNALQHDKPTNAIVGLKTKNGPDNTLERDLINDLDSLPFPAWHLLPMERYFSTTVRNRYLIAFSSRGCPWNCSYCSKKVTTRKYRMRSAPNIVDELESNIQKYKLNGIYFADDIFTCNRKRTVEFCQEILKRNLDITWKCLTRVNVIDLDLLRLMRNAGCAQIEFGIESGSSRILEAMNKGFTLEQIIKAGKDMRNIGIRSKFYMIVGYPGETGEDVSLSRDILFKAKPSIIGACIFNPLPETDVYKQVQDRVTVKDYSDFNFIIRGSIYNHEHFSHSELEQIRAKLQKDYYKFYRSTSQKMLRVLQRLIWYATHWQDAQWRVDQLKKRFFSMKDEKYAWKK